jgi:hypothetical protein
VRGAHARQLDRVPGEGEPRQGGGPLGPVPDLTPVDLDAVPADPATRTALGVLQDRLDAQPRDWARYTRRAAEFHIRNARAWASAAAGEDLAGQIDPDFSLGAHALAMAQT